MLKYGSAWIKSELLEGKNREWGEAVFEEIGQELSESTKDMIS